MTTPTVYPLEMPGRAIANEIQCWIGDIETALQDDEFRKEIPGAIYYAARILPGWYPIISALDALHEHARKAENAASVTRCTAGPVTAFYSPLMLEHSARAAEITADLILWSIQARADFEKVAPALM
ncbi:MAG: hypothetical protein KA170_03745 [Candidatus Promineofilum sp.]|nr:hypothetical protein [Promineifilum sp.]